MFRSKGNVLHCNALEIYENIIKYMINMLVGCGFFWLCVLFVVVFLMCVYIYIYIYIYIDR